MLSTGIKSTGKVAVDGLVVETREAYTAGDENLPQLSLPGVAAETAIKAQKNIDERKIRDWTEKRDVINAMKNDLDDLLFSAKGRYNLPLTAEDIDEILEGILLAAERREVQQ